MNKPFDLHDYAKEVCGFGEGQRKLYAPELGNRAPEMPKMDVTDRDDWKQIVPERLCPVLARLMGHRWSINTAEGIGALDKERALTELRATLEDLYKDALIAWEEA